MSAQALYEGGWMRIHAFIFVFLTALLLTGCGSQGVYKAIPDNSATPFQYMTGTDLRLRLIDHYSLWRGTPYKLGGNDQRGIDCSGFTQQAYRQQFDLRIPRTTDKQLHFGTEVMRADILPGDLVFFSTGVKLRHVGVYLGQNEFLHASTSRGVMISRLDNIYWNERYLQSRRIVFSY